MVYPMGTSHHMFSAGEEHMGVVRNARPSLASSDQNGVFVSGCKDQCEVSVYIVKIQFTEPSNLSVAIAHTADQKLFRRY